MDEYVNYIGATLSMQINNEIEAFVVRSVKACAPLDEDITINAKKIYEAIKNAEKYKWHDLRRNPEDVPTHDDLVIVSLEGNAYNLTWVASPYWLQYEDKIIAWKEIEPFEEDNE